MKKNIIVITLTAFIMLVSIFVTNNVFATSEGETESKIIALKEKELSSLADYEETYGSKSYGFTAYILHRVQIFSIPTCILGIMISAIYQYVLGIKHLEVAEKGMALMISFITIGVICQVLPLVFTIVVKFGRE